MTSLSTEERRNRQKNTLVLVKPLDRKETLHKRYYCNNKELDTETILRLLKLAGHIVEEKSKMCKRLPSEYMGIKIDVFNYGMMVCPRNQEDYIKLRKLLKENGYLSHVCGLSNDC